MDQTDDINEHIWSRVLLKRAGTEVSEDQSSGDSQYSGVGIRSASASDDEDFNKDTALLSIN